MASKRIDLPPGVLQPREAVLRMAPYNPPTGGRADKLRLDFNENPIGCSPAVVNSVVDALSPLGVRHIDMPLTPEKIWKLIKGGRA